VNVKLQQLKTGHGQLSNTCKESTGYSIVYICLIMIQLFSANFTIRIPQIVKLLSAKLRAGDWKVAGQ